MQWPMVRIRWRDSTSPRGWQPLSEWKGVGSLECVSVGYLYADNDESKTIIPHFSYPDDDDNRQGNGIMVIPTGAIISIECLTVTSSDTSLTEMTA
jgi:hypothetical protein